MLNQKGFVIAPLVIWAVMALIGISTLGVVAVKSGVVSLKDIENNQIVDPTPSESPTSIPTYPPTQIPKVKGVYVDPDPIVNCGPGQTSKQYVKDRQSNCKNYVDCGFNNNVWTMMLKTECDKKQAEESSKNNSNNNTYTPPSSNTSNKVAVYLASVKNTFYCSPQNIDTIKQLDSAVVQENQKALNLYDNCLKGAYASQPLCESNCNSQADYSVCLRTCSSKSQELASMCKADYYQANILSKQLLDLCNK